MSPASPVHPFGRASPAGETPVLTEHPVPGQAGFDQATGLRRLAEHASRVPSSATPALEQRREPHAPVVTIASGKGGVGKSTLAVNLAIALHRTRATTLVDADHGTANADVLCGLAPSRRLDLELFREVGPDLRSVTIGSPFGFRLVPGAAGVANAASLDRGQRARFAGALRSLGEPGGVVLVDLSAGIGACVVESVAGSDLGVIVTTPEPTALADAYALIKCVVRHRGDARPLRLGLVVNQADSRAVGRAAHNRVDRVCQRFLGGSMPLLGIVRSDRRAVQAVRTRLPLVAGWPHCPASRDVRGLAVMVGAIAPRVGRGADGGDRS